MVGRGATFPSRSEGQQTAGLNDGEWVLRLSQGKHTGKPANYVEVRALPMPGYGAVERQWLGYGNGDFDSETQTETWFTRRWK
jgi:hypothetical protein